MIMMYTMKTHKSFAYSNPINSAEIIIREYHTTNEVKVIIDHKNF